MALAFSGNTSERGDSATVTAVLTEEPTSDVTLTFNTLSLASGVSADSDSLTFTPSNWNVPQAIRLTATNDGARNPLATTQSTLGLETVETKDKRFDCASGFVLVPHTFRHCKDGVLDSDEGEQCEPPRNDLDVPVVDLRCALGEASCERCDHSCQLVPGNFRAVCGDGLVTDVERCEVGDEEPCTLHGRDRGTVTCTTDSCQWDTSACRDVAPSCDTPQDRCDSCPSFELQHTCVLDGDGHARCFGLNLQGQASPPSDKTFSRVVDTPHFSCGLEPSGAVDCWGLAPLARDLPGPFIELVAGGGHVCGRGSDGTVVCWGENGLGQATVPNGSQFKAIAAGRWHTCGIGLDDVTTCWGRLDGELGQVPDETFVGLGAGQHRTCGLRADGSVRCWGGGLGCADPVGEFRALTSGPESTCGLRTDGTIGCFTGRFSSLPRDPPGDAAIDLAGDTTRSCLVTDSGELRCFGIVPSRLGDLTGPFKAVGVGGVTCAIKTNGQVWCVDDLGPSDRPTARMVLSGAFEDVGVTAAAGIDAGCARRADGEVKCWGEITAPIGAYRQLSVNGGLACGVRTDDSVGCWGRGAEGLGMPEFDSFSSVSSGNSYACGVRLDGTLLCWDLTREGLFGGRFPMQPPAGKYLSVAAGTQAACAIEDDETNGTDGPVRCWGNPTARIEQVPAGRFTKVVVYDTHACGIRSDGRVVCWGQPAQFQLRPDQPTALPPQGSWDELKAAEKHGCARRGTEWRCWGDDAFGRATPPEGTWSSFAVGDEVVCGVTTGSQSTCWHADGRVVADWKVPPARSVVAGAGRTCRVLDDRSIDCASDGRRGHVGPFTHLAMGRRAVCGILSTPGVPETDGNSRCFGLDPGPDPIGSVGSGYHPFIALDVGSTLSCFVNHEGKPQCLGALAGLTEPPPSLALKTISVETGRVCGVTTSDTLGCWGRAEAGRPDGAAIVDVQLSYEHGCVLEPDGAIQCWGVDHFGNTSMPGSDWAQVGVGARQTCAVDVSGKASCRGWLTR